MAERKGKGTQTSAFGSPGRISHDSSALYKSRLYADQVQAKELQHLETPLPKDCLDRIFPKSAESMSELPDHSIHLMATSPPYNVQKEYDQNMTLEEYIDLIRGVGEETFRVLVTGGRACINIANLGRKPYLPLHSYIIEEMLDIGFLMRGEIILDPFCGSGTTCVAAIEGGGRRFVGYEINYEYIQLSKERIEKVYSMRNKEP